MGAMWFFVLLVLLVIAGMVFTGMAAFGLSGYTDHLAKKAEAHSPQILDAAFDGRADVVFKVNLESMRYETVMLGARDRGYVLANETIDAPGAKTLIFTKG
jgi:hypothetical protein